MEFNNDITYKGLMNEVLVMCHTYAYCRLNAEFHLFRSFQVLACKQGLLFKLEAIILFWCCIHA